MDFRQLQYFISVAETANFSEAARRHFISQSALSQQIRALEDELKAPLFVRNTHSVVLTEVGEELLPFARKTVVSLDECRSRVDDVKGLSCGTLNLGLTASHEAFIREAGIQFLQQYPGVVTNVCYSTIDDLLSKLRAHQLDMVFSVMPSSSVECLDYECVLEYRLCAIMRTSHPLAHRRTLSFADLRRYRFVLPEPDADAHNPLEHIVGIDLSSLDVSVRINDVNAILNLVGDTDMISILTPQSIIGRQHLTAIPVDELSVPIKSYVFFASDAYRKQSAMTMLKLFKEVSVPRAKILLSIN